MGVANGCKEVYRFPHNTYPYSSCICSSFMQNSIPTYFLFIKKKKFFVLVPILFVIKFYVNINFFHTV